MQRNVVQFVILKGCSTFMRDDQLRWQRNMERDRDRYTLLLPLPLDYRITLIATAQRMTTFGDLPDVPEWWMIQASFWSSFLCSCVVQASRFGFSSWALWTIGFHVTGDAVRGTFGFVAAWVLTVLHRSATFRIIRRNAAFFATNSNLYAPPAMFISTQWYSGTVRFSRAETLQTFVS